MYVPPPFRQERFSDLHDLIETHPLGTLVVQAGDTLEGTHVPCVVDRDTGEKGALRFHLAAANPVCGVLDGTREALFMFSGADAYVSPDWYCTTHLVPTWNYAAVHVYGRPAPLDDEALCRLLDDLSAAGEARLPKKPWTTDKLPDGFYGRMRRAVVGYHMPVARMQGKWKLSQNRSRADRAGVIEQLRETGGEQRLAMARLMRECD